MGQRKKTGKKVMLSFPTEPAGTYSIFSLSFWGGGNKSNFFMEISLSLGKLPNCLLWKSYSFF